MADNSSIEWTDASWNPVTGCTEVSPGCDLCYARVFAERFRGVPGHHFEHGFDLRLWPDRLALPLRWKRPRRIFVNSVSDLFHQDIPTEFILAVFDTMRRADQHTYQVLTKRPSRAALLVSQLLEVLGGTWPGHVWMGVSVETQDYTWRVDKLRQIPVPTRFISAEPLLGPLSLNLNGIAWAITGAESGRGARPMKEDWVRSLRDQATLAQVAFFYKQNALQGRKLPLPMLDGVVWNEFPDAPIWRTSSQLARELGGTGGALDEKPWCPPS